MQSSPSMPKPHDKIWYHDGNIILASKEYLYRVHNSVLSMHSTVFRDMLQIPLPVARSDASDGVDDGGQWEGIPIVKMMGDSDEDVFHTLSALYDGNVYKPVRKIHTTQLVSLLRMSRKYDFRDMYESLMKRLEHDYTYSLTSYDDRRNRKFLAENDSDEDFENTFILLSMARNWEETHLLPHLFYKCATSPITHLLKHGVSLGKDDHPTLMRGRDTMQKYACQLAAASSFGIADMCRSFKCEQTRKQAFRRQMNLNIKDEGTCATWLVASQPNLSENELQALCHDCRNSYIEIVKTAREEFWNRLPISFGLPCWNELTQRFRVE